MSEAIPPLPNTPSWRGAQLKKSTGTTLPFTFIHRSVRDLQNTYHRLAPEEILGDTPIQVIELRKLNTVYITYTVSFKNFKVL